MNVLVAVSTTVGRRDLLKKTCADLDEAGASEFGNEPGHAQKIVMCNGHFGQRVLRPSHKENWWRVQENIKPKSTRTNLWAAMKRAVREDAEKLLYFEDDILPVKNIVSFMAAYEVPENVALLTFFDMKYVAENSDPGLMMVPISRLEKGLWGCQALSIPRKTLDFLVSKDPFSIETGELHCGGDRVLGQFIEQSPWPRIGIHVPSLVQHIGKDSIARPGAVLKERTATNWPGADFDPFSLLSS